METTLMQGKITEKDLQGSKPLAVKKIVAKYNESTNAVTALAGKEISLKDEYKKIQQEIKEKTQKLADRKKEIKQNLKTIEKKKLYVLGTVATYQEQLQDLGLKIKQVDITNLLAEGNGGK